MVYCKYVIIEQVQHKLLESPVKVYNFVVEDFYTYYVGEESVLVHNKCLVGLKKMLQEGPAHGD